MRKSHVCASILTTILLASCGGSVTGPSPHEEMGEPLLRVEVSQRYGGAVAGLHTPWGNVVDSSNGGTLLSTAVWTLPIDPGQTTMCSTPPCEGTLPFLNPTQGGYLGDGHAGNPYPALVSREGDAIRVSYRAVNYNFGWPTLDRPGWQTDWWGDVELRQRDERTVVMRTRITYCKDMAPECAAVPVVVQDSQLSTIFGRGQSHPDPVERGPFTTAEVRGREGCVLDAQGRGVCLSVADYEPIDPARFGVATTPWPSLAFVQPDLERFPRAGVRRVEAVTINGFTYSDIPRFEFQPGGWYEFTTTIRLEGA